MSDDLLPELRAFIGGEGPPTVPRDPVNVTMIRHWCDAMDDRNPLFVDGIAASQSRLGGIAAPAAMLDVWDKPGLAQRREGASPFGAVLDVLDANGFTSVVAVNSELEFIRPVRVGDRLSSSQTLDAVSEQKQTALGVGHFVTVRFVYRNQDGDHVGNVLFRVLKFRPGTARPPAGDEATTTGVDPARRPRPGINRDNRFFWDGCRAHELRIQSCNECGHLQYPPLPSCGRCGRLDMGYVVASGRGAVYSFAVPHHPPAPGFRYPLLVALIELEEGVRLVSNVVNAERAHLQVGLPVEVCWLDSHPALVEGEWDSRGPITLPQFRPRRAARAAETKRTSDVRAGDQLPLCPIPLTPTLIASGALATRDFTPVHHDRDYAVRAGSKDIFMNIHTTLGLAQRYIDDWAGPEVVYENIRVRLGAPNYPDDTMTMTGSVHAVDVAAGRVTVAFRGFNQLGNHAQGTVDLLLPDGSAYGPFVKGR